MLRIFAIYHHINIVLYVIDHLKTNSIVDVIIVEG